MVPRRSAPSGHRDTPPRFIAESPLIARAGNGGHTLVCDVRFCRWAQRTSPRDEVDRLLAGKVARPKGTADLHVLHSPTRARRHTAPPFPTTRWGRLLTAPFRAEAGATELSGPGRSQRSRSAHLEHDLPEQGSEIDPVRQSESRNRASRPPYQPLRPQRPHPAREEIAGSLRDGGSPGSKRRCPPRCADREARSAPGTRGREPHSTESASQVVDASCSPSVRK